MKKHKKDILTIDVDWASDDIINDIADYLIEKNVKATWFITHDSQAIRRLKNYPDLFERGIHPNFFYGSSQGKTEKEVLDYCMNVVPEAVSTRSHGVYQHGRLLNYLVENTPLKIDSTTFLPEMEGIYPLEQDLPAGKIIKAPFFWADDYEICINNPFKKIDRLYHLNGMRIYMFHPIHIALNTSSWKNYDMLRNDTHALSLLSEYDVNEVPGVTSIFIELVAYLSKSGRGEMLKSILD